MADLLVTIKKCLVSNNSMGEYAEILRHGEGLVTILWHIITTKCQTLKINGRSNYTLFGFVTT